jgi:multisubunit Na+/H+ antiporter MnhC subunit
MPANILTGVGFNPYRKFRARPADYALVITAVVVAVALVAWAFLA